MDFGNAPQRVGKVAPGRKRVDPASLPTAASMPAPMPPPGRPMPPRGGLLAAAAAMPAKPKPKGKAKKAAPKRKSKGMC